MFGGVSAEHEVSVVTGLQALEHLDATHYEPHVIYVTKKGEFRYLQGLTDRYGFLSKRGTAVVFGKDAEGGFVTSGSLLSKKIRPHAAFLAFHGGLGEGGAIQGLLESLDIPFTGSTIEGAVIAMNKKLTKQTFASVDIPTVPDVMLFSDDIRADATKASESVIAELGLPVIVKPVHLGSSIGLAVAKTSVELQKALLAAAFTDSEIIVEPYLEGIIEFNCAVRKIDGKIEASEIEKPVSHDAILSFADKYQRGGKKTGGMASLSRELPAKIPDEQKRTIQQMARMAFSAARLSGMARIDFMQDKSGKLYLTEINPIPGSMAFYLWEASGIPYRDQISNLLEQSVTEAKNRTAARLEYSSDIIERFVRKS